MDFVNLYIETHYSMNGSNIRTDKLIEKAISLGYSSLAITDNRLYGLIKFYKKCKKNKIKPILGLNLYLEGLSSDSLNHILVYAKNNDGYQSLLSLASLSALNNRVTFSELKKNCKGIILVIDTDNSDVLSFFRNQKSNELNEFYSSLSSIEDFYFSVSSNHDLNIKFETLKKLIVLDHVKYLDKEDKEVYEILSKIFASKNNEILGSNYENHFKDFNEIKALYGEYPNAIARTHELTKDINVDIEFGKLLLPKYIHDKKGTSKEYLEALVYKGLEKRLKDQPVDKELYFNRIKYELKIIDDMGYNDYFLIVWDFVKYSKQKKYLIGPGRGSAAASLVSYCLGITSIDSIKYDLVFERFLNPERITMPDIDMDLPDDKRDDIIKYVRDFYGINKVASICTFGTFLSKSAIRDTARILEAHSMIIEEVVKESSKYDNIETMIKESGVIQNIMNRDETANKLLLIASKIEGLQRHVSTHAAGIIVTKDDLTKHTAVQSGLLDMMQTQYEAKDLEDLGLLKIDFLGLRNLTSIDSIVRLINEGENTSIDIYKTPTDDKKTFELLKRVETTGIFQLESQGMRSLIGQMQIDSFEDIVTILALYRPGPMENIPSYIRRRNKEEGITFSHKILEEILEPTNGIIIYQEQILKIANKFAGYSMGEADVLRRAVSKKQESALQLERKNFVSKSLHQGHKEEVSNEIYDYIVKFANYGFNRAHSVAYGMVSYWMAYLKANYPKYFISVLTSSVIGSETQMKNYIFEANKLGVRILKPSVNKSTVIFSPEDKNLRYPLLGIKNVGLSTVKVIVEERENKPYKSYIDFINRNGKSVNKRAVEYLVYSGAFDEFGVSKKTMIEKYDDIINFSLYGSFIKDDEFMLTDKGEFEYLELEEKEKLALGFNLAMNPILLHEDYITKHKLLTPSKITRKHLGTKVRIVGVVGKIRVIKTKKNTEMAFIVIEDEFKKIDSVLFPESYQKYIGEIESGKVYLFMVSIEERNKNIQFIVDKVHKLGWC